MDGDETKAHTDPAASNYADGDRGCTVPLPKRAKRRRRARRHKNKGSNVHTTSVAEHNFEPQFEPPESTHEISSILSSPVVTETVITHGPLRPARKIFKAVNLSDNTQAHLGDTYIQPQLAYFQFYQNSSEGDDTAKYLGDGQLKIWDHDRKRFRGTQDVFKIRELRPICGQGGLSVETLSAPLGVYAANELFLDGEMRVDRYAMIYSPVKVKVFRLIVTICIDTQSRLWRPGGTKSATSLKGYFSGPSRRVLHAIMACIRRMDVDKDQHIYLQSNDLQTLQIAVDTPHSSKPTWDSPYRYLQQMSDIARHWEIPWYREDTLDRHPLNRSSFTSSFSNSFLAWLNNRWVLDLQLGTDKSQIDAMTYNMDFFHALSGRRGFAVFHGVVRDHYDTVTAFLLEAPAKGMLMRTLADESDGPSKQRREKWCQQLVGIVKEAHSLNKVIGYLGENIDNGVTIDENDDLKLYKVGIIFAQKKEDISGALPPEYVGKEFDDFAATMESDLYQLGFLLWRICGNHNFAARSTFCEAANCDTPNTKQCRLPHTNPIELPMSAEVYPEYLRRAICACRAEDPRKRVPAHEMLSFFPQRSMTLKRHLESEKQFPDAQELSYLFGPLAYCDLCRQECTRHLFHCYTCSHGNFDICLDCFLQGKHCLDLDHDLQEYRGRDEEIFHSSPGPDGKRTLTEF